MDLQALNDYLETHSGRDKILKTLSYTAKLFTVCSSESTEKKLITFGSQMSKCRVILRLLDDVPRLTDLIQYGWGKKEHDRLVKWSQVIQNVIDTIASPVEHIAWAGQHNIVSINVNKWDLVVIVFWILSLKLSLLRSIRQLVKLQENHKRVHFSHLETLEKYNEQRRNLIMACTCCGLDMIYAISYLPPGVLWGGRLKTWHVGALGTTSSLIGLYRAFSKQKVKKAE